MIGRPSRGYAALSKHPKPGAVLNLASSTGLLAVLFSKHHGIQGTTNFTFPPPEAPEDAIFVESGLTPTYRRSRSIWGPCTIAGVVAAGVPAVFLLGSGSLISDYVLIVFLGAFVFALVALCMLYMTELARRTSPWAIVLQHHNEQLIARLAYRAQWCPLHILQPKLAVGQFELKNSGLKRVPDQKLPDDLKGATRGIWLMLRWQSRVRWVLLGTSDAESRALEAMLDWADKLNLDAHEDVTDIPPPEFLVFSPNVKLW